MSNRVVETLYRLRDGTTEVLRRIGGAFNQSATDAEQAGARIEAANRRQQSSLGSLFAKIGQIRLGYFAVAAAVTSVIASVRNWTTAASTQANAEARLETAIRNGAGATQEQIQALKDLAAERQRVTRFGDEQTIAAQAQLATFRLTAEQIGELIPRVQDLAEANRRQGRTNVDLEQSAILVGRAITGNVGALSRYGVVLTSAQQQAIRFGSEQERVAAVAEALDDNFKGLSTSLPPFERAVESASNGWGDFREKLGEAITESPAVIAALETLTRVVTRAGEAVSSQAARFDAAFRLIGAGIMGVVSTTTAGWNAIQAGSAKAAEAIIRAVRGIADALARVTFGDVRRSLEAFVQDADQLIGDLSERSAAKWDRAREAASQYVETVRNTGDALAQLATNQERAGKAAEETAAATDEATEAERERRAAIERTAAALEALQIDVEKVETGISSAAREATASLIQLAQDGEASLEVLAAAAEATTKGFDDIELQAYREELGRLLEAGRLTEGQFEAMTRQLKEVEQQVTKSTDAFDGLKRAVAEAGTFTELAALAAQVKALGDAGELTADQIASLEDALNQQEAALLRNVDAAAKAGQAARNVGQEIQQGLVSAADKARESFAQALLKVGAWIDEVKSFSEGARREVENLIDKLNMVGGAPITDGFRPLYRGLDEITRRFDEQATAADRLIDRYRETGDAMGILSEAARLARENVTLLDETRLNALNGAIRAAREEMEAARRSSADLVESLTDDLLRLQGATEQIEERRRNRQRDEIRLKLQQQGLDRETRANLEESLRLMDEIERTRRNQATSERDIADNIERQQRGLEAAGAGTGSGGARKLDINLNVGGGGPGGPNLSQMDLNLLRDRLLPAILQQLQFDSQRS